MVGIHLSRGRVTFELHSEPKEGHILVRASFAPHVQQPENEALRHPVDGKDGGEDDETEGEVDAEPEKVSEGLAIEDVCFCAREGEVTEVHCEEKREIEFAMKEEGGEGSPEVESKKSIIEGVEKGEWGDES
jgi:hypothetical protein